MDKMDSIHASGLQRLTPAHHLCFLPTRRRPGFLWARDPARTPPGACSTRSSTPRTRHPGASRRAARPCRRRASRATTTTKRSVFATATSQGITSPARRGSGTVRQARSAQSARTERDRSRVRRDGTGWCATSTQTSRERRLPSRRPPSRRPPSRQRPSRRRRR